VALLAERYTAPAGALVLDGGTLGLSLLPYLESADALILVDAIRAMRSQAASSSNGRGCGASRGDAPVTASGGRG
jgi:hypothetical protein